MSKLDAQPESVEATEGGVKTELVTEEHRRAVNTLCKKRKAIFNRAYEISTRCY